MAENSELEQKRQADRQEHDAWGRFPPETQRRGSSEARKAEESIYNLQVFGWHRDGELGRSPPCEHVCCSVVGRMLLVSRACTGPGRQAGEVAVLTPGPPGRLPKSEVGDGAGSSEAGLTSSPSSTVL